MNTNNLACPHCGFTIPPTTPRQDNVVFCPACRKAVLDPGHQANIPPPVTPFRAPPQFNRPAQQTNGLAIASLALSAGSLIIPLAWLPGIICGHIARGQIRRNATMSGQGIALAGILVGYGMMAINILVVGAIIAFFSFQHAQRRQNFRPGGPPPMVRQFNPNPQPTERGIIGPGPAALKVDVEKNPVSGSIEGTPFQITSAKLSRQGGTLNLRQDPLGQDFIIFLFPRQGESLAGKQWNLPLNSTVDGGFSKPHVHFGWREGNASKRRALSDGYELQLQLGPQNGDEVPGRITLRIPGEPGTEVKGDFSAVIE